MATGGMSGTPRFYHQAGQMLAPPAASAGVACRVQALPTFSTDRPPLLSGGRGLLYHPKGWRLAGGI